MRSDVADGDHGTVWFEGDYIVCADEEEVLYSVSALHSMHSP
jgi:hypothetical protein